MSNPSEVLFDRAPVESVEDSYPNRLKYVRLNYTDLADLPKRLYEQLQRPRETAKLPEVLDMVGMVVLNDIDNGAPERLGDVRLHVEFGGRPELLAGVRMSDIVPIDDVPDEMGEPRLAKRRQYKEAHEEALMRRGEGWDCSEDDVMQERIDKDPTGTGEGGVPPLDNHVTVGARVEVCEGEYLGRVGTIIEFGGKDNIDAIVRFDEPNETKAVDPSLLGGYVDEEDDSEVDYLEEIEYDRHRVGSTAPHVTKVFLRDRKTAILVVGEFHTVQSLLEPKQPHPLQEEEERTFGGEFAEVEQWIVFQRVERGNVCSSNEIAINPVFVVSVESERF